MRIGICYNIEYHADVHGSPSHYFEQILEQVELLEELGYDSVWFSEHHSGSYSFGNPAVIAAAAAQRTRRIRIGTGVSLLPLHHPIHLAEQYAMLDVLSGGRLEYGIGRGYLMQEYEWLKIPIAESHGRYREAAEFIVEAWSQAAPIDFHGRFFDVGDYACFPTPIQRPHPPIYASAVSPESFEWAGKMGFNMGTALFVPDLKPIRDGIAVYQRTLAENGFDPASREIMAITQMYCAPTKAEALRDGGQYATNYYRFFSALSHRARTGGVAAEFQTMRGEDLDAENRVLLGDPSDLIPRINALADDLAIDFLLMEVEQGGAPPANARKALELFGREVLPQVQRRKRRSSDR